MKITIVMGAFLPVPPIMGGAVEKAWFALAQEFASRGHDVVQISRSVSRLPAEEVIAGVKHIRVRGYDTPRSLAWLKFLDLMYSTRAIRRAAPSDIIVTNTFWSPLLWRNPKRGKLYVHVARFPKGQMRFYRHAARLQAPSQSVADAIRAEVPEARVKVIPYPRPDSPSGSLPEFGEREKTILYVGRVHPEKGVHLLLEAFVRLPERVRAKWKLVIVGPMETRLGGGGDGYRARLEELAGKAKDQIDLRGPIFGTAELATEFRRASLFAYPSLAERGETFGLAALEAMAHGCAVLVSDLACFRDFIEEGSTGFFFDHRLRDPAQGFSNKIAQILEDESLLARVAEAGWRKSAAYALPRVADQFLDDFVELQTQCS
ncbi:MAG TPA: glycosyltransferase family 4 protein [Chthoniobacterales bacterium]|nr:glycosyltransferase family 4 protein [Chthoniobacterales bacterium]